jgi:oxygen-independent coproporphyrinogen-3 oxidase
LATQAERLPEHWLASVEQNGSSLTLTEIPSFEAAQENLLMHVRLTEGVNLSAYRVRWGRAPSLDRIAKLRELGLVTLKDDRLAATPRGRLVLNSIIADLAALPERETAPSN